eukprot:12517788-Alexandrium_andersonii.AAC.1
MPEVDKWLRGTLQDLTAVPWAWRRRSANADALGPLAVPRAAQPEPARPRAPSALRRASITSAMLGGR